MRPANKKLWSASLLAVLLAALAAAPAHAYYLLTSAWPLGTAGAPTVVTLQLELQTTGPANKTLLDGDTNWDQVALDAIGIWNQALVGMQFQGVPGSTAAVSSSSNGINTVSWAAAEFDEAWPTGVVGLTYRYWLVTNQATLPTVETDVIFNSNVTWNSYRGALQSQIDLRRVALHEFGHALGLAHPDDYGQTVVAVMNAVVSSTDSLQADDLAGGQYLYNLAPVITTQPASQAAPPGGTATFVVATTNNPAADYQWYFNNSPIAGATSASLTLSGLTTSNQGNYQVRVSDRAGAVTSQMASLTVAAGPAITTNPVSQSVATGGSANLSVAATGSSLTYQWYLNGAAIAGATGSTYALPVVGATDAGVYTVAVFNGVVTTTSAAATLTVNTNARLINLSTKADTGTGGLTAGLVIGGSGSKNVLIRGIGPTLATAFGVAGALTNPVLTLNTTPPQTDAGWGGTSALINAFNATGAFQLPATSADSALLASLGQGSATATVIGQGGAEGTALIEVYDDDSLTASARLLNLSVIANSTTASNLTAGFVISGTSSLTLLIRGDGPALAAFGQSGLLAQPVLDLHSGNSIIATNTGWGTSANAASLAAVFNRVGAFALAPGSADSALVVTLAPGSYSAVVSGLNGTSGNALIEIYEIR